MKRMIVGTVVLLGLVLAIVLPLTQLSETKWVTLHNRAWSIEYPADWRVGSCTNCQDVTDPEVFVDFLAPNPDQGFIIVEPLYAPQMSTALLKLAALSGYANLNPVSGGRAIFLNGRLGLQVRNINPYDQTESETVYIASSAGAFSISISGKPGPVEALANYPTYRQMVANFRLR